MLNNQKLVHDWLFQHACRFQSLLSSASRRSTWKNLASIHAFRLTFDFNLEAQSYLFSQAPQLRSNLRQSFCCTRPIQLHRIFGDLQRRKPQKCTFHALLNFRTAGELLIWFTLKNVEKNHSVLNKVRPSQPPWLWLQNNFTTMKVIPSTKAFTETLRQPPIYISISVPNVDFNFSMFKRKHQEPKIWTIQCGDCGSSFRCLSFPLHWERWTAPIPVQWRQRRCPKPSQDRLQDRRRSQHPNLLTNGENKTEKKPMQK